MGESVSGQASSTPQHINKVTLMRAIQWSHLSEQNPKTYDQRNGGKPPRSAESLGSLFHTVPFPAFLPLSVCLHAFFHTYLLSLFVCLSLCLSVCLSLSTSKLNMYSLRLHFTSLSLNFPVKGQGWKVPCISRRMCRITVIAKLMRGRAHLCDFHTTYHGQRIL